MRAAWPAEAGEGVDGGLVVDVGQGDVGVWQSGESSFLTTEKFPARQKGQMLSALTDVEDILKRLEGKNNTEAFK